MHRTGILANCCGAVCDVSRLSEERAYPDLNKCVANCALPRLSFQTYISQSVPRALFVILFNKSLCRARPSFRH